MESGAPADPREELAELAASVRAYLEWQADTGATGLPAASAEGLGQLAAGAAPAPARPSMDARPSEPRRMDAPPEARRMEAPHRAEPPPEPHRMEPPPEPRRAAPPAEHRMDPPAPRPAAVAPPAPPRAPSPIADAAVTKPLAASTGAAGPDERRTRLALIAEEVRSCTRCVLHEQRKQTVFARGNPFAELCFVGEGPGADEDRYGEPFVGAAGQLLDRMVAAMGYQRDDVYICNIVKCRPPNNRKPEPAEMAACTPFLTPQLALVQPRVIVALGATAVQGLIGTSEGITRMRGKWKLYKGSIPIMPTFHPAYLLRNPAAKRDVWNDLQDVMRHLGKAPGKA